MHGSGERRNRRRLAVPEAVTVKPSRSHVIRPSIDDEINKVDSNFIAWLHKKPKGTRMSGPLADTFDFLKNHFSYRGRRNLPIKSVHRRTLSPQTEYELLFATKPAREAVLKEHGRWRKQALERGPLTPCHKPYLEVGSRDQAHANIDGKAIMLNHLACGLTNQDLRQARKLDQKKDHFAAQQNQTHDAVAEYMKKMKCAKKRSAKCKVDTVSATTNLRFSSSSLHSGTEKLYEMLHETEHRLLCIQAGGSYLDHLKACKKRRKVYHMLTHQHHNGWHNMKKLPAVTESDRLLSAIRKRATAGKRKATLTLKDVITSTNFNKDIIRSKQKQFYYDKLTCIYIIMVTLMNMKQPSKNPSPLTWAQLKKLRVNHRHDVSFLKNRRLSAAVNKTKYSKSATKSGSPLAYLPAVSTYQSKRDILPPIYKRTSLVQPVIKEKDKKINEHVAKMPSKAKIAVKLPTIIKPAPSSSKNAKERLKNGKVQTETKTVKQKAPGSVRNFLKTPMRGDNSPRNKSRVASASPSHLMIESTEPEKVAWEDFLKWGEKEPTKDKKMRFAGSTRTAGATEKSNEKRLAAASSMSVMSEKVPNLNDMPRKSVAHMWQLMRKSFLDQLKESVGRLKEASERNNDAMNSDLMKKFGLDGKNPVSHLQLNWLKIKMRANKLITREIKQKERDAVARYHSVITSHELSDTIHWKHKWMLHYQAKVRSRRIDNSEQYMECIDLLVEEAKKLDLQDNFLVNQLIDKIKHVYLDDRVKFLTIFRGQVKIQWIVMSLPAFELCTEQMQLALKYVLVEVLQGETDMLPPMFKQRGLPLHPSLSTTKDTQAADSEIEQKRNIKDFVKTNRILSTAPPAKPGMSRNLIQKLQKNVVFH